MAVIVWVIFFILLMFVLALLGSVGKSGYPGLTSLPCSIPNADKYECPACGKLMFVFRPGQKLTCPCGSTNHHRNPLDWC